MHKNRLSILNFRQFRYNILQLIIKMIQKALLLILLITHCQTGSLLFVGKNNIFPDRQPVNYSLPATKIVEQVRTNSTCQPLSNFQQQPLVVTLSSSWFSRTPQLLKNLPSSYVSVNEQPTILIDNKQIYSESSSSNSIVSVVQQKSSYSETPTRSLRSSTTDSQPIQIRIFNDQAFVTPSSQQPTIAPQKIVTPSSSPPPISISYDQYLRSYKSQYNENLRSSVNNELTAYRTLIFNEKLKMINSHNANLSRTYDMGLNQFTDLNPDEIRMLFSGFQNTNVKQFRKSEQVKKVGSGPKKFSDQTTVQKVQSNASTSTDPGNWTIDWRCVGDLPVFQIRDCGSCSFFSAIDTVHISLKIWGQNPNIFSAQAAISCAKQKAQNVCAQGIDFLFVYEYMRKYGIGAADAYPYTDQYNKVNASDCNPDILKSSAYRKKLLYIKETYVVEENDCKEVVDQLRTRVLTVGIVANQKLVSYQKGTFNYDPNIVEDINHAVVLVGYNSKDGYLVKNAWGAAWGMKGYAYVTRDSGVCLWALYAKEIYQLNN